MMAFTTITHIPYKVTPKAVTSILFGEVQIFFVASAISALPLIQSGQVIPTGVSSKERIRIMPEVPAIAEFVKAYAVTSWNGILAPASSLTFIVNSLYQAKKISQVD